MAGLLPNVLEGRYLGSFVGSFDGTGYDVGGPCVGLLVEGIRADYDIDDIQLNDSSYVSCKSEM